MVNYFENYDFKCLFHTVCKAAKGESVEEISVSLLMRRFPLDLKTQLSAVVFFCTVVGLIFSFFCLLGSWLNLFPFAWRIQSWEKSTPMPATRWWWSFINTWMWNKWWRIFAICSAVYQLLFYILWMKTFVEKKRV